MAPWTKGTLLSRGKESIRRDWNNLMCFKIMKCSKNDGDKSEDTGTASTGSQ